MVVPCSTPGSISVQRKQVRAPDSRDDSLPSSPAVVLVLKQLRTDVHLYVNKIRLWVNKATATTINLTASKESYVLTQIVLLLQLIDIKVIRNSFYIFFTIH